MTSRARRPSGRLLPLVLLFTLPALADPPRVLRSTPEHADLDVDPALAAVIFEFDQDMDTTAGFSICGGGPAFPERDGPILWRDARTLLMPVRLQPGRTYHLSLNCPSAANSRSAAGEPARVAVLIGPGCMSSNESFIQMRPLNNSAML